jgi:thiamine phosphate synthase YjbQ (UPF0047 family)
MVKTDKSVDKITVVTQKEREVIEITNQINKLLQEKNLGSGVCHIFATEAKFSFVTFPLSIESILSIASVRELVSPELTSSQKPSQHDRAILITDDALAALLGTFLTLPFEDNQLLLGHLQGVFLVELNGPQKRTLVINLIAANR